MLAGGVAQAVYHLGSCCSYPSNALAVYYAGRTDGTARSWFSSGYVDDCFQLLPAGFTTYTHVSALVFNPHQVYRVLPVGREDYLVGRHVGIAFVNVMASRRNGVRKHVLRKHCPEQVHTACISAQTALSSSTYAADQVCRQENEAAPESIVRTRRSIAMLHLIWPVLIALYSASTVRHGLRC